MLLQETFRTERGQAIAPEAATGTLATVSRLAVFGPLTCICFCGRRVRGSTVCPECSRSLARAFLLALETPSAECLD